MKKNTKIIIWTLVIIVVVFGIWKMMDKPEYNVASTDKPYRGNSEAEITITEFSDLECPACRAMHPTVKQILVDYDGDVRLEYKHFPLESIHAYAFQAAEAAECANDQGEFWAYIDKVFENQNDLAVGSLIDYAEELGMDRDNFEACLKSGAKSSDVRFEMAEGRELGVSGTPSFFVNGKKIERNSYDALKAAVEAEMRGEESDNMASEENNEEAENQE